MSTCWKSIRFTCLFLDLLALLRVLQFERPLRPMFTCLFLDLLALLRGRTGAVRLRTLPWLPGA